MARPAGEWATNQQGGTCPEAFGFRHLGPIRGTRIDAVIEALENAGRMLEGGEGPILIHAITATGSGYAPAEADPFPYHGVTPFEVESGVMRKAAADPPSSTSPPSRPASRAKA